MVTTLLRTMHAHPDLLARADYQARYDALLTFSRELWDGWSSVGLGVFYRSRTHMASHWARIGMDLFLITGETKYRVVFDNVSHGVMFARPSNLREQLKMNPDHPTAYVWSDVWGDTPAESIQDTSHAGAVVSFIHEATLAGMYWSQGDIDALADTLMLVIWEPALQGAYHQNVDGTEPTTGTFTEPYGLPGKLGGRMHEWLHLGRHRPDIQKRIETEYIDPARRNIHSYGVQIYGIGGLNARTIGDGQAYY